MNLYNKYIMRSTGEKQFQPKTQAETLTFSTFDFLKENNLLGDAWKQLSEEKKNNLMESFKNEVAMRNIMAHCL